MFVIMRHGDLYHALNNKINNLLNICNIFVSHWHKHILYFTLNVCFYFFLFYCIINVKHTSSTIMFSNFAAVQVFHPLQLFHIFHLIQILTQLLSKPIANIQGDAFALVLHVFIYALYVSFLGVYILTWIIYNNCNLLWQKYGHD